MISGLLVVTVVCGGVAWAALAGVLRTRVARRAALVVMAGAILVFLPYEGVDFSYLKRANLLVAVAVGLWMLLRHLQVPWALDARRDSRVLVGLAVTSAVLYFNFFAFHGLRTFVHYHDVAHYYLGSKYFPELGYRTLYTAMLRAEQDVYGHVTEPRARDLATGEVVPADELLGRSDEVRARFTGDRWVDFAKDVVYFRRTLGPALYQTVIEDHGFNPTPVWAVLGGALANRVPAGSATGIRLLSMLDPLLLAATFGLVGWTFGRRTALLCFILFCLVFGATFGWTGGAFLRYVWFASVMGGLCLLERKQPVAAGALLGLATALRVFPILFIVGPLVKAVGEWRATGKLPKAAVRLVAAFVSTGILLGATTLMLPEPIDAWQGFRANMRTHMSVVAPNIVGLSRAVTLLVTGDAAARGPFERGGKLEETMALVMLAGALIAITRVAPRLGDAEAYALGAPLALVGLNLAAYYWILIVVFVIVYRDKPLHLAALFGVELATHALYLFEPREDMLYAERSFLIAFLLAGYYSLSARPLALASSASSGEPSGVK